MGYLRQFLPDNFTKAGGDNDAVILNVLFPRLAAKAKLLTKLMADRFPGVPGGTRREHVTKSHKAEQWAHSARIAYTMSALIAVCGQFESALGNISLEDLSRLAQLQPEMSSQERVIDGYLELLRQARLDAETSLINMDKVVTYFQNVLSVNISADSYDTSAWVQSVYQQIMIGITWCKVNMQRISCFLKPGSEESDVTDFVRTLGNELAQCESNRNPELNGFDAMRVKEMIHGELEKVNGSITLEKTFEPISKYFYTLRENLNGLFNAFEDGVMEIPQTEKFCLDEEIQEFPTRPGESPPTETSRCRSEGLRWQLEKKDMEILELKKTIKSRLDDISNYKLRLDMAEARIESAGKQDNVKVQHLEAKIEQLVADNKKKQIEFDETMDALQKELKECERENAELKQIAKNFSRKTLLDAQYSKTTQTDEDCVSRGEFNTGDRRFLHRIHGFLQRYGIINYAALVLTSKRKRVVITGGGTAGIAIMEQLYFFSFDVVLLEARKRLGGRVHTYHRKVSVVADLGVMVVTGIRINGNPIVTMVRQTQCTPVRITPDCPIYDEYAKLVNQRKDELVAEAFKKIGGTASYIAHTLVVTELNGNNLSIADAHNDVLEMLELLMRRRSSKYRQSYEEILEMKQVQYEITLYKKSAEFLVEKLKSWDGSLYHTLNSDSRLEQDIVRRCYKCDLGDAIKRYDATRDRFRYLETTLRKLKKQEPSVVCMNQKDCRLIDFHFANLEYVSGGTLDKPSLQHFDQDEEFQFTGSHMTTVMGSQFYNYGSIMILVVLMCIRGVAAGYIADDEERPINMKVQCETRGSESPVKDPLGYFISALSPAVYLTLFVILYRFGLFVQPAQPAPAHPSPSMTPREPCREPLITTTHQPSPPPVVAGTAGVGIPLPAPAAYPMLTSGGCASAPPPPEVNMGNPWAFLPPHLYKNIIQPPYS